MPITKSYSLSQTTAPPLSASSNTKAGWVREAVQAGEQYLQSQRGWQDIEYAQEVISGATPENIPRSLSKVKVNISKRQVREVVANLANLRPIWQYSSEKNKTQAIVMGKMLNAWWHATFVDRSIKTALQYAATEGLGWMGLSWDLDYNFTGRGDISSHVYGARDVLPVQIGEDHDIQKAYAVIIRKRLPLVIAHALHPDKAHLILPDEATSSLLRKGMKKFSRYMAPVLNAFGPGAPGKANEGPEPWPMVTMYHTYIMDSTYNDTGQSIMMGRKGTNWTYLVPSVGGMKFDGYNREGEKKYRPATVDDSALFPFRRLIVTAGRETIADGSSPWYHGMVPVVPFYLDKWPFEFLPFSMLRDTAPLSASINTILRYIDDSSKVRLRPPLAYDDRYIPKSVMRKLDTRQPGQTLGFDMSMGEGIKPILDPSHFDVPAWVREHVQYLRDLADYMVGVQDFAAIAKASQIPATDAMEKFQEVSGPLLTDATRSMESSITGLGNMWKGLALQFYTTRRIVEVIGAEGVVAEEFDYKPDEMIPSHMPGESTDEASSYSAPERARFHVRSFQFKVTPNSMNQITQTSRKLLILQLWRSGFPIDPWTVGEHLDVDLGDPPKDTPTIMKRWIAWQRMKVEQAADAMELMERLKQQMGDEQVGQQMGMGGMGGGQGAGNASGTPGQAGPGRPPSGQVAPSIETRSDGAGGQRTIVSESR